MFELLLNVVGVVVGAVIGWAVLAGYGREVRE